MKGLRQHLAGGAGERRDRHVMRGRPEAIGVGRIEESAPELNVGHRNRAARRDTNLPLPAHDAGLAVLQAFERDHRLDRLGRLLDEMQHQSVDALVSHHELHRPEGAF
jgi:hypothetical protein